MFFSRKDKDKELDDIKDLVNLDEPPKREQPRELRMPQPAHENRMREEIPTHDQGAPLFVKVEKYKDIITTLHELKLFLSGTKQLFTLLGEIEGVRAEALNILKATIQRLERSLITMDSELARPRGMDVTYQERTEATHIGSSLNDLQRQLMELKRELGHLK